MAPLIEARDLTKKYGAHVALDRANLNVEAGRIVGLIGPNGAGKTSALRAILGLTRYEGQLTVLGREPFRERTALMNDCCFIADVAVLPSWLRVDQAIDFVAGVHPRFRRDRATAFLAKTQITGKRRMRELSKGMKTQVHLALTMAIDAKLLVLDEPTLGLDILARRAFYDALVNDYMDETRTILITTHQVEEVENLLTDLMFIDKGRIVLDSSLEDVATRFTAVAVSGRSPGCGARREAILRTPHPRQSRAVFRKRRPGQSSRGLARSTRPALPIFSSRSFREVQHEQQQLAHPPGILGKPRDLDDSRGIRRAAAARRVVRPGQHSASYLAAGIRGSRRRLFGDRSARCSTWSWACIRPGICWTACTRTARTAASCSGSPCRYRMPRRCSANC